MDVEEERHSEFLFDSHGLIFLWEKGLGGDVVGVVGIEGCLKVMEGVVDEICAVNERGAEVVVMVCSFGDVFEK
ncbi:hypothetical protein LCGC14_1088900 [marine sediment metagenome]|uniref:Uncharacterized protein n=1 Tax=marine sediment metagenome TaxID=412755 RepID=A0A0F9PW63_9ZZZZ